jgi:mono/diheme cytochrome c family protein
MADYLLLGLFDNVEVTADAVDGIRQLGIADRQVTIMSNVPYPARFFGRKPPRLWFFPFVLAGALGGVLIAFFITFVTPQLYPIVVGGQELTPVPPTAIIFFEFIAMGSMVGALAGFLMQNKFPILTRRMYDERITEGFIGVEVRANAVQAEQVGEVFEAHHAQVVRREDASAYPAQGIRHLLFWGGVATAGLGMMLVPLLLTYDVIELPWISTMSDTVVVGHQEGPRRAAPPEAVPVQGPVLIAGEPASKPLPASDVSLERGQTLFGIYCAVCHGAQADGNGPLGKNTYFKETPSLTGSRVAGLTAEDIFLVITNGKNRMPSLAEGLNPGETWDIVNYVQSIGAAASAGGE